MAHSSWHVRCAAVRFLQVFVPRHSLSLQPAQVKGVQKLCVAYLKDAQLEVRVAASHLLASLLTSTAPPPPPAAASAAPAPYPDSAGVFKGDQRLARLHAKFARLADTKLPKLPKDGGAETKSGGAASSEYAVALCRRHAGVLGLSALVSSHPYDLPVSGESVMRFCLGRLFVM